MNSYTTASVVSAIVSNMLITLKLLFRERVDHLSQIYSCKCLYIWHLLIAYDAMFASVAVGHCPFLLAGTDVPCPMVPRGLHRVELYPSSCLSLLFRRYSDITICVVPPKRPGDAVNWFAGPRRVGRRVDES